MHPVKISKKLEKVIVTSYLIYLKKKSNMDKTKTIKETLTCWFN